MKRLLILLFTVLLPPVAGLATARTLWQIGERDGRPDGLALAPDDYASFLTHDFGWEDRFYLVGHSVPGRDFPYVLPGPADFWGGTSHTAGIRTHVLNMLFRVADVGSAGEWRLEIDFADTHSQRPPLLKVTVNGRAWKFALPAGGGDGSLEGDYSRARPYTVGIPLAAGDIRPGGNEIRITTLEGSWAIFDAVRLEAPDDAVLAEPDEGAYVRSVHAADYRLADPDVQPLLVDVEHLAGEPEVRVELDGRTIFGKRLERGRYVLEAPMPAVRRERRSRYAVFVDDRLVESGTVARFPCREVTPADYVDTHMGSAHSRWMLAPGPWMPFGMVKLSPDNQNSSWQAGYDPSFESVGTFSHIHEWTMAGLGTLPVNGVLRTHIGDQSALSDAERGYRSAIDKSSEVCRAGYYAVRLTDYDILAELTATTRCGFQRYTYPADRPGRVMIDLKIPCEYDYRIVECRVRRVNDRRLEGYCRQEIPNVWSSDADQYYTLYFVVEFDRPMTDFGGWCDDALWQGEERRADNPLRFGCYAEFDTRTERTVRMRTGISYVDLQGASENLRVEVAEPFGWDFDAVRQAQVEAWNDILGRVEVRSDDRREKVRFYTNLYRAFCRNTFSDSDGRWCDASGTIRRFGTSDDRALGCDAFWNTFWNLNPLWNLLTPEWSSRWVRSQLAMYDAGGWLAKGPAGMKYIPVMVAEHEIPLLVGAWQMGIRDYDADKLFAAVYKMQTVPGRKVGRGFAGNRDLESYMRYGYVPADKGRFSNTLEYAYDDWCVAQLARSLGRDADYARFSERGTWWRHAIDTLTGYARMRYSDGRWEADFDPFRSGANQHYVEGNAWQLTYFVPQDVPALAEAIGRDRFVERLEWGFAESEPWRYNAPGDQYWDFPVVQGNQQSMHFAFLFNWVGRPWLTQRWSRSICDRYYGYDAANAWLGDEDQGQMSAWFVLAALGLFQTDGGCSADPHYEIGSPLFEEAVLDLGGRYGRGRKLTIRANRTSRENKYVQSLRFNGRSVRSFRIPAAELLGGGVLELEMGAAPNPAWGVE